MIGYILMFLGAICNAIMDRTENSVAFNASVFSKFNPEFWNKEQSWDNAKRIFKWKFDAWHLFKSMAAVAIGLSFVPEFTMDIPWQYDLMIRALIWNLTFNLFYHQIFKK